MSGLVLPGSQKPHGLSLPGKVVAAAGTESAGGPEAKKDAAAVPSDANAVIPGVMGIVPTLQ